MTKQELNVLLEQKISNVFSNPEFYRSVRESAFTACEDYCKENEKNTSFTLQSDFMDEYVLRAAITTSIKETVSLLCENGLINVED